MTSLHAPDSFTDVAYNKTDVADTRVEVNSAVVASVSLTGAAQGDLGDTGVSHGDPGDTGAPSGALDTHCAGVLGGT
jgi:hypothetical protein